MKVGIIVGSIAEKNGTERAVVNLVNMINDRYEVTIFSGIIDKKIGYDISSNVNIVNFDLPVDNKNIFSKLYYYFKLSQKIRRINNFDYLIGTTHLQNIFLYIFSKKGVKVIACEHMSNTVLKGIKRKIREYFYKKVYKVVVLTKADYNYYKNFIKEENLEIIPNTLSFTSKEKNQLINKKIIAVGRLTKQKGFDLLIKSLFEIKDLLLDWNVEIYGEGEEKEVLNKMIESNNMNNIIKIKNPIKNIKDKYLESSIYVLSSRWEGLPMVLLEAMECGLPIVAYDCPTGPNEVIEDGKNGYLIKPNDIRSFAIKIKELIENENLRKSMGKYSKEKAQDFSNEKIKQKWELVLK